MDDTTQCKAILNNKKRCTKLKLTNNPNFCQTHANPPFSYKEKSNIALLLVGIIITSGYVNSSTPCKLKCVKFGHDFTYSPDNAKRSKCPKCKTIENDKTCILTRLKQKLNKQGHKFIREEKNETGGHYKIYYVCKCCLKHDEEKKFELEPDSTDSSNIMKEEWGGCVRCWGTTSPKPPLLDII